jgi:hypothetical protein
MRQRAAILVAGPRLAGTTSLRRELQRQLPSHSFIEFEDLGPADRPIAVVFVVSGAAQMVRSDCQLLDRVAARTDAVLGVVAKIDAHRSWRSVLDSNRDLVAGYLTRYAVMPWIGVAAAPDLGGAKVDGLISAIESVLAEPHLALRNRLRAELTRHDAVLTGLRRRRRAVLRAHERGRVDRAAVLRRRIQTVRLELSGCARRSCEWVRTESLRDVDSVTGRASSSFLTLVRQRAETALRDIDTAARQRFVEIEQELRLRSKPVTVAETSISFPSVPPARRLESRLATLLGLTFGLGVTLTLGRVLMDVPPPWGPVTLMASLLLGAGLGLWVAGTRGLLHRRANLDRWINEVAVALRAAIEERVVSQALATERRLADAVAACDAAELSRVDDRLAKIDGFLHARAAQRARAADELEALRAEFG